MMKLTSTRFRIAVRCVATLGIALGVVALSGCSTNVAIAPSATSTPVPATQIAQESTPIAAPATGTKAIAWQSSYEKAWDTAYKAKKPLMIDFYTDWCGACKSLDANTYTDASVIQESDKFVSVKINAEKRTDIAQQFGIRAYPTIVWLDNGAKLLNRIEGAYPPQDFIAEMNVARGKFTPIS